MGYREVNWALPRERQIILSRQNIYDGTWEKTPSMGWMFVPLMEYHGGGKASTMEPLHENLETYEQHLINNLTSGVQAHYRGLRLYDTEKTKQIIQKWVRFFKQYRDILESDIIHVRRPDGTHIDCMMHVNTELETKGLAVMHNPKEQPVEETIYLPLYYTGMTNEAVAIDREGNESVYKLDRHYGIEMRVSIEAKGTAWFVLKNHEVLS
ncbi:hypothetical protein G4V62_16800 [Bacillaceae bacterium SIJ1]|uniref:hypothetical protein n=1 Tax=Litoribacterium kuwaitense TaxID=1398745 RepID=UPI0013EDC3EF|nr:hypothetical protein [Litoribacterium kuwaitense]NGP46524.1 hypothetical protein [Litoribacterium kuwaitense]